MSDYIIDASVVIQHLLNETYTPNANALFDEVGKTITVYVPEFCLLECTNVLWKQVRFQGMPASQADQMVTDLMAMAMTLVPTTNLLKRGLQIGLTHQLAVYDSLYIALAETLNYPLVTVDERQSKAALAEGVHLKPLSDFTPLP
jgi:predicted nucleic acid-binding protein